MRQISREDNAIHLLRSSTSLEFTERARYLYNALHFKDKVNIKDAFCKLNLDEKVFILRSHFQKAGNVKLFNEVVDDYAVAFLNVNPDENFEELTSEFEPIVNRFVKDAIDDQLTENLTIVIRQLRSAEPLSTRDIERYTTALCSLKEIDSIFDDPYSTEYRLEVDYLFNRCIKKQFLNDQIRYYPLEERVDAVIKRILMLNLDATYRHMMNQKAKRAKGQSFALQLEDVVI